MQSHHPNFAKLTDSKAAGYIRQYGCNCWELDALDPQTISDLIENEVLQLFDDEIGDKVLEREKQEREQLREATKNL